MSYFPLSFSFQCDHSTAISLHLSTPKMLFSWNNHVMMLFPNYIESDLNFMQGINYTLTTSIGIYSFLWYSHRYVSTRNVPNSKVLQVVMDMNLHEKHGVLRTQLKQLLLLGNRIIASLVFGTELIFGTFRYYMRTYPKLKSVTMLLC